MKKILITSLLLSSFLSLRGSIEDDIKNIEKDIDKIQAKIKTVKRNLLDFTGKAYQEEISNLKQQIDTFENTRKSLIEKQKVESQKK